MNNKLKPAIIGGVALGVLSAIPFVNIVNACCCAWVLMGGALAAYLYIKDSPNPVTMGEGAMLGAMSGVIGTVISWIIGIPLSFIFGDTFYAMLVNLMAKVDPRQAEILQRQIEMAQNQSLVERLPSMLLGMVFGIVVITLFAAVGGLIGTALFEKRKRNTAVMPPPPPPPTPGYGG